MPGPLTRLLMGLFTWIRGWFAPAPRKAGPESVSSTRRAPPEGTHANATPRAPLPVRDRGSRVGNLDRDDHLTIVPEGRHQELMWRLGQRIERGDFEVPKLPPASLVALEMANKPSVEIRQLVETIERDPLLTGEMLRIANSALYSTANPAATLQQAVLRLGLRSVRGVVFSAAMKSSILNGRGLNEYSEEVWRQAQSVARIARAIAPPLGIDPEQGHVIGLLHDIGKVALLGLLQRELASPGDASPAIVGLAFHTYHQRAGEVMSREWKLPDDLVAIAGCHHDFAANRDEPRGAALAFLAHQLDLRLSLDDENGLRAISESQAFEILGAPDAVRYDVIERARRAWIDDAAVDEEQPAAA